MPMSPEKLRAHRKRLRAKGICTRCHKHKARDGLVTCGVCHDEIKARRRKYRKDPKRCECGRNISGETYRCPKCASRAKALIQKMRLRRVAVGECCECGRKMPEAGYRMCRICQDHKNRYDALRRAIDAWHS